MAFHERTTMMSGTVNKTWNGGVVRMAGMEGIICGGVFLRVYAGPSMHIVALNSGDVYGGGGRVSAARVNIAGIGYRSCDSGSVWAAGAYIRNTNFTIEPALGTPSTQPLRKSLAGKMGKLALSVCPFMEIGFGMASLALAPIFLAIAVVDRLRKKPKRPPPAAEPRSRFRTIGLSNQVMAGMRYV